MTLKGITVVLIQKNVIGYDKFNAEIVKETSETVDNVLIGEPSTDDVSNAMNLYGKKIAYTLAIPKNDSHNWEDCIVEFFGKKFKTIGTPTQGIEELIPLQWNKKVKVERYEQLD